MIGRGLLRAAAVAAGLWAAASSASDDAAVRAAVARLTGGEIEWIKETNSPMLRVVKIKGSAELAIFTADGKAMIPGGQALVDTSLGMDMLGDYKAKMIAEAIKGVPDGMRIRYPAVGAKKHTLVVYMDVDCGYCKRLHQHIPEFNRRGISVEYILYARAGASSPAYRKHAAILCAPDRHRAVDAAMGGLAMAEPLSCDPGTQERMQASGVASGLNGTPMVAMLDGTQLGGYVTPDDAIGMIEYRLALQKAIGRRP